MTRGFTHRRSGWTQTLAALALLAVFLRAFMPAGYMAAPTADGRAMEITLCSGHGPVAAVFDLTTGTLQQPGAPTTPHKASVDAPCAFAAAAPMAPPQAPPAIAAPLRVISSVARAFARSTRAPALAAPPPWATGPPLSV